MVSQMRWENDDEQYEGENMKGDWNGSFKGTAQYLSEKSERNTKEPQSVQSGAWTKFVLKTV